MKKIAFYTQIQAKLSPTKSLETTVELHQEAFYKKIIQSLKMKKVRKIDDSNTLIFQPSGPNFFRSCMIAWKKHNPNTNFLHVLPSALKKNEIFKL